MPVVCLCTMIVPNSPLGLVTLPHTTPARSISTSTEHLVLLRDSHGLQAWVGLRGLGLGLAEEG